MDYLEQQIINEFRKLLSKKNIKVLSKSDSYIINKDEQQINISKINNNTTRTSNFKFR